MRKSSGWVPLLAVGAAVALLFALLAVVSTRGTPGGSSGPISSAQATPPAGQVEPDSPAISQDVVLVRFRTGADIEAFRARHQLPSDAIGQQTPAGFRYVRVPAGQSPLVFATELNRDPDLEEAGFVVAKRPTGVPPHDPRYKEQWGPRRIGVESAWGTRIQQDSKDVLVAVLDSGIDREHPDLRPKLVYGQSEIPGVDELGDQYGHGTHVAGIAGAVPDNDEGIVGVGWAVRLVPVRVFDGDGHESHTTAGTSVTRGIAYVSSLAPTTHQRIVVNMSLGSSRRDAWAQLEPEIKRLKQDPNTPSDWRVKRNGREVALSQLNKMEDLPDEWLFEPDEQRAIQEAASRPNVVLVASSANDDDNWVAYPAAFPEVIAVGATTAADRRASTANWGKTQAGSPQGSNYGPKLDVVAPGDRILSTTPVGSAKLTCPFPDPITVFCFERSYGRMDGTSMAAPHVSGVAALVWAREPTLSGVQVVKHLLGSAEKLRAMGDHKRTDEYGYGLVSAGRAVVYDRTPPTVALTLPQQAARIQLSGDSLEIAGTAVDDRRDQQFQGRRQELNAIPTSAITRVEYRIDGGSWQMVAELQRPTQDGEPWRVAGTATLTGWPWDQTLTGRDTFLNPKTYETTFHFTAAGLATLAPGEHAIEVRTQDSAGNWSVPDATVRVAFLVPDRKPATSATVLVVDVSGSMDESIGGTAKLPAAQRSAANLLQFLRRDHDRSGAAHSVGLVTFSSAAQVVSPVSTDLSSVEQSLARLRTSGNTNIGAALDLAVAQIERTPPGTHRMVILMTDGATNTGANHEQIAAGPAARLASLDTCLATIGFGAAGREYDEPFLRRLGGLTKCGGFFTAADAHQLENAYLRLSHETAGTLLSQISGTIAQAERKPLVPFTVAPGQAVLNVTLNWPGSRLDLELRDPSGEVVRPGYPGATIVADERPVQIVIARPRAGQWQATVVGADVPRSQEPFTALFSSRAFAVGTGSVSSGSLVVFLAIGGAALVGVLIISRRSPLSNRPRRQRSAAQHPEAAVSEVVGPLPDPGTTYGLLWIGNRHLPLARSEFTIGRDPAASLALQGDERVSRRHARILRKGKDALLEDLGSANGTFVNGLRIARQVLRPGDRIMVGNAELIYDEPAETRPIT